MAPKPSFSSTDRLACSSQPALQDYAPVAPRLPVLEETVTQIEAGEFRARVATASSGGAAVFQAHVVPKSVGVTVLQPGFIGFAIPHWWDGDYRINGIPASSTSLYCPDGGRSCHIAASERVTTGIILPRDTFLETVAALSGVDPDDVPLDADALELTPEGAAGLRRDLNAIMAREVECQQGKDAGGGKPFEEAILTTIVDGFLSASSAETFRRSFLRSAHRIVRRAEDRFAEAGGGPVSLADLCRAAGVGKSALYEAFHFVCDMAPMAYFQKRRLAAVRSALIAARPAPGAVKQAALGAGITELGRFSSEYRNLFGELPSVTLTRSREW